MLARGRMSELRAALDAVWTAQHFDAGAAARLYGLIQEELARSMTKSDLAARQVRAAISRHEGALRMARVRAKRARSRAMNCCSVTE